jgi:hypothetical protein
MAEPREALKKNKDFYYVPLTGSTSPRILIYSRYPFSKSRQKIIDAVSQGERIAYYSFFCAQKKDFGSDLQVADIEHKGKKIDWNGQAQKELRQTSAPIIVFMGVSSKDFADLPKKLVEISVDSMPKKGNLSFSDYTDLWKSWFQVQWDTISGVRDTQIQTKKALQNFFAPRKRKATVEEKKEEKGKKRLRSVEEPIIFRDS